MIIIIILYISDHQAGDRYSEDSLFNSISSRIYTPEIKSEKLKSEINDENYYISKQKIKND